MTRAARYRRATSRPDARGRWPCQTGDNNLAKTKGKRSLSDGDIATYQRRTGPMGGAAGTDADSHAHTDTDIAPKAGSDSDAAPPKDRDA